MRACAAANVSDAAAIVSSLAALAGLSFASSEYDLERFRESIVWIAQYIDDLFYALEIRYGLLVDSASSYRRRQGR